MPRFLALRYTLAVLAFLTACAPALGGPTAASASQESTLAIVMTSTIAPTETRATPTAQPTPQPTATSTYDSPYGHWSVAEAVTVKADLTEEELNTLLENLPIFPLLYTESEGIYAQSCILESISFLKEGHYISVGDFNVRIAGQCSYLDVSDVKQTITVALAVENAVERTTWIPFLTEITPGTVAPSFIQEFFTTLTEIEPGRRITVSFNLSNPSNQAEYRESRHHGDMVSQLYTEEQIEMYRDTGDPAHLNHLLVPFSVAGGRK